MRCDVCDLPDTYGGRGDGIGSCDCSCCDCGNAQWSYLCTCPNDEEWPDDVILQETYPGSGIYE